MKPVVKITSGLLYFSFLLLFITTTAIGQGLNFIPNGSLEEVSKKRGGDVTFHNATNWNHNCVDFYMNNHDRCKRPLKSNIQAYDGVNMLGIYVIPKMNNDVVSVELVSKLIEGTKYRFSFYYRPNENNYREDVTISYCFNEETERKSIERSAFDNLLSCQTFTPKKGNKEWSYFETEFIANGTEKTLVLYANPSPKKNRYYYLFMDKFELVSLDESTTIRQ